MNSTNTTTGAYVGSDFKTGNNGNTALADIKAIIQNDFGAANILTHRNYFANAVSDGRPSAGAWGDSDVDLINESMVYGGDIFSPHPDGTNVSSKHTIDKTQLKLFAERPDWWLCDAVLAEHFANDTFFGFTDCHDASVSSEIRPVRI